MISQGYFEHTSPAGVTFIDRIEATGYMQGARSWTVGENLVWGTGPLSTPQALVTAWMNSPPHRENLLRPAFREIGIAAVAGTPVSQGDLTGVTVSSEYGYRTFAGKKSKQQEAQGEGAQGAQAPPAPARDLSPPSPGGLYRERSASGKPLRTTSPIASKRRKSDSSIASTSASVTSTSPPSARDTTRWARLTSPPK